MDGTYRRAYAWNGRAGETEPAAWQIRQFKVHDSQNPRKRRKTRHPVWAKNNVDSREQYSHRHCDTKKYQGTAFD
jgi:hypothetical protein